MKKIIALETVRAGFNMSEIKSMSKLTAARKRLKFNMVDFKDGSVVVEFREKKGGKLVSSIHYSAEIVGYGREKISEYDAKAEYAVKHLPLIKKTDRALAYSY